MTQRVRIAIIGAGFAGLGMAIQLVRHGIDDFVVIERADQVGGTWRDNTYPGAGCDIRSDLYSFSFAPNPDWTHRYGRQPEILAYLKHCAQKFDLESRILFGHELERAAWDDTSTVWSIQTSRGTITADILISGHGPLIDPVWPDIPNLGGFTGPRFHSARWDHGVDLTGKRIAVIGTGASAIQFVPELQKIARELRLFQRTPAWIVPRGDRPTTARRRAAFRRFPALQRLSRAWIFGLAETRFAGFRSPAVGRVFQAVALRFLHRQVSDSVLRAKLTPHYRIGCKRILVSDDFLPALTQSNVLLITDPIMRIDGDGLVTADGTTHQVDVLICGTGFNATRPPVADLIQGHGGTSLAESWMPHMAALRGTAVFGFPNLFILVGPNTALGHNSIVYIIEAQIDYVLAALRAMDADNARSIEPNITAQADYNRRIQRDLAGSTWTDGGCASFYLDASGRNTTLWPHRAAAFRASVREFDMTEFMIGTTERF